ncbi:unnamed protein product [Linum trigynum]|uniref:Gnk2-homologous domain-containing protein n=1 Tax=Linum trigynum TaxID=586398 RepID=A0AAV2GDY2_9ROSI
MWISTLPLRFLAVIFIAIVGTSTAADHHNKKVVLPANVRGFSFPYHFCSSAAIDPRSDLGRARANILTDVVKLHWTPRHRQEQLTCVRTTVGTSTVGARAECHNDPSTSYCNECLVAAKIYLETNCRYFAGGRVNEQDMTCTLLFGDYDICAA